MPVTGLVIVLDHRRDLAAAALDAVRRHGRFTLGPDDTPGRRPAVLETDSLEEDARVVRWLKDLPGVALVEIASIDFRDAIDDREQAATAGRSHHDR